jgi:penicillin amidase
MSDLERVQADVLAVHARELMPRLTGVQPAGDLERRALDMLKRWDLQVTADSAAAAVFEAWYVQLAESLFADELGDALWRTYSEQLHMVSMAASSAVRTDSAWCDDVRTGVRESCTALLSSALSLAVKRMAAAQESNDPASWQWGRVHRTVFFHTPFDSDPELSKKFNRIVSNGGDKHTVNVASNPRWSEYDQRHIALYRQIIDLADITQSRWMAAPGQSGILTDPHYDDLIEDWRRVGYRPMLYTKKDIDEEAVERLELRP